MLPTKFWFIWPSGFRGEDFLKIGQSEFLYSVTCLFYTLEVGIHILIFFLANLAKGNMSFYHHLVSVVCHPFTFLILIFSENPQPRCFLPSFSSFVQVVSEEKIFKNRPIRNKNSLWQSCLLMDQDEVSNLEIN
jgi:hypothetical protein